MLRISFDIDAIDPWPCLAFISYMSSCLPRCESQETIEKSLRLIEHVLKGIWS